MINIEMTSLEIAEITGKEHRRVRQDIKGKLLQEISLHESVQSVLKVETSTYTNTRNKEYEVYKLNNYAVNALMSTYSMEHAISLVMHMKNLEDKLEEKQKELDLMQSIVWEVINGQSWIGQLQCLKMAGIKHPVLFMRYLKENPTFLKSVLESNKLQERRVGKDASDRCWKFSQEGFKWLLSSRDTANIWVQDQKALRIKQAEVF